MPLPDNAEFKRAAEAIGPHGRVTSARQQVLVAMLREGRPLSAKGVRARIDDRFDEVTVYRCLEWLESVGLAIRRARSDGVWMFLAPAPIDPCITFFECSACGRFDYLGPGAMPRVDSRRASVHGATLMVSGVCADCLATAGE